MALTLGRVGFAAAYFALVLLLATGCGGSKDAAPGMEVELFAKAQEFQKKEQFAEAIEAYRQIVRDYPKTRHGANSQFMIGYIYANHLNDLEQARIELNRYLDKFAQYSDSGLVAGAKFELENLGKSIDEIPIIAQIGDTSRMEEMVDTLAPVVGK